MGQQFKFVIDNGKRYLISKRYSVQRDSSGNENNIFDPKKMNWVNPKKQKALILHAQDFHLNNESP